MLVGNMHCLWLLFRSVWLHKSRTIWYFYLEKIGHIAFPSFFSAFFGDLQRCVAHSGTYSSTLFEVTVLLGVILSHSISYSCLSNIILEKQYSHYSITLGYNCQCD